MDARRFVKPLLLTGLILALVGSAGAVLARGPATPLTRPASLDPLGFAFTYQGRLMDGGNPANGLYDFEFKLFDSANNPIGPVVTVDDHLVTDGLFTVQLDFGPAFDGSKLWLQIGVRPGDSAGPYTTLTERQELTAAPYALYALDVGVNYAGSSSKGGPALDLTCSGCVDSTDIQNGTILFADIGQNGCLPGQVIEWDGAEWSCTNAYLYVRTVIVNPVGTPLQNGTALLDAVKGIDDASPSNPYLVKIEPGRYDLGSQTLVMQGWVDMEGSGELVTTITASGSSSYETGTVVGSDNAELRFLTVANSGADAYAIAIYNGDASPTLRQVTATAAGGTLGNYGVRNATTTSSSPTMIDVTATASGGGTAAGVDNAGSSPTMKDVTATGSGATGSNYGIYNDADSMQMTDVTAIASGGTDAIGVRNCYCSTTMTNVTATASGGSNSNLAVWNQHSSATLTNVTASAQGTGSKGLLNSAPTSGTALVTVDLSRITAATNTIDNGADVTALVGASQLAGGTVTGSVFTCAGVYDENYTFYSSTCP